MALLRCHGDSNCNKTQIIRNFHLYMKHLWKPFFLIFTHGDVANVQTWEVSPQKIQSSHLKVLYFFQRKFIDEHQTKLPKMLDLKLTANFYWKFQPTMTTILFWNSFCSNRPLPSSKNSRFQNETKCKTFVVKMSIILEVLIEEGSAAVSCDANRTKTVCKTVEHMNSFLLKSIT